MRIGLLAAFLAFAAPRCGLGNSLLWRDPHTLEVNLGTSRYIYHLTPTAEAAPTTTAYPILSQAPDGSSEVGAISVEAQFTGGEGLGRSLRRTQSEFYPELANAAARLGGTHFHIVEVGRYQGIFITALTVSVLRVPSAP